MPDDNACYRCGTAGELRQCARCKQPICQPCAHEWRQWGANTVRHTTATCRPCFWADVQRDIDEARAEGCDEVEIAPRFEDLGCWG